MNKFSRFASYTLIAMLLLGIFFVFAPRAYAATTVAIVNPADGTNDLFFTTAQKSVGDNILINITITDVNLLGSYQAQIGWDPTLLDFVDIAAPTDSVFAGLPGSVVTVGPDTSGGPGEVIYGQAVVPPTGRQSSFNGTGTLAVLTLKIIQGVSVGGPTMVTCPLTFLNPGTNTFFLNNAGNDIPVTYVPGTYKYSWVTPGLPSFSMVPSTIKPAKIGDIFSVAIMVSNVDPNWEITTFQFSIMWNTTLMTPTGFSNGTFLETFQYQPGGVVYAEDLNQHDRPPPLTAIPPDYNYSIVGELLLPDPLANNTYHPPFPSGSGLLGTFYFQAIYETIAPVEYWSSINFILEDFLVLNDFNMDVGYQTATGAAYRAPVKVLGLSIDLYTQYVFPFGGQGGNQTSDSFGPQDQVELFALVTYNEYPVQQKLVGYQIFHQGATQTYVFTREGTTDANGIAHVSFRLPWPCADPVGELFGWWYVNATVEVAGQVVVDNLKFWVWWPVEVVSIEPKFTTVTQTKQGTVMSFEMVYRRFDALPKNVLLTATVYDELGFFIGSASKMDVIANDPVTYDAMGDPIPTVKTWDFDILIPSNAVVGKCIIYGNAFTDWPWNGGVPYCPEVTNTIDFYIAKPGP